MLYISGLPRRWGEPGRRSTARVWRPRRRDNWWWTSYCRRSSDWDRYGSLESRKENRHSGLLPKWGERERRWNCAWVRPTCTPERRPGPKTLPCSTTSWPRLATRLSPKRSRTASSRGSWVSTSSGTARRNIHRSVCDKYYISFEHVTKKKLRWKYVIL